VENVVDAVRGMRDVLPEENLRHQHILAQLNAVLVGHGYQAIDLPLLEHRDLYVRKLGEELAGKIYEFTFHGRDLVLRPEWTASVLRAYISKMNDAALPLRLRYNGPVFRYERPQRGTWRQFTQLGVEMIGAAAPRADAEVLGMACAGLQAASVIGYRITLGHIGIIRALLGSLGVSERTRSVLTWSLERMRARGVDAVRDALLNEIEGEREGFDTTLLDGLDDTQAEGLLLHTLRSIGVNLQFGTRPPEEIVRRLVRTLRRTDQRATIERAIAFLAELSVVRGAPAATLQVLRDVVTRYTLPDPGFAELQSLIDTLPLHGVPLDAITLDFGLGRGLHYYTGMMFEIDDASGMQLCGGGRYDELVTALGGRQSVPAVGFAYGVERVVLASQSPASVAQTTVNLIAEGRDAYPYALQCATRLRAEGFAVVLDERERPVTNHVREAQRRGNICLVVTAADAASGTLQWRDARDGRVLTVPACIAELEALR
jgi:histidyl-tRNA synthetase